MAFTINNEISWLFVIVLPILGIALFSIIRYVMPLFTRLFKKYDNLNNFHKQGFIIEGSCYKW